MKGLILNNDKEKLFLDKLIISDDIYDYPKVKNEREFRNAMTFRNHERSWVLTELDREVEDNLLLLVNKDARVAYLNRLIEKIIFIRDIQNERIDNLLADKNKEEYEFLLNYPNEPQIYFSVSRKAIIHNRKAGLLYLKIFEIFVRKQLKIEIPEPYNEVEQLKSILKDGCFDKCLDIMKGLEIIDNNNKSNLTLRTGYKLFALIDAINNVIAPEKQILARHISADELVSIFNKYLGTVYKKHNRPTKNEKLNGKMKGYYQALKDAKELIKKI